MKTVNFLLEKLLSTILTDSLSYCRWSGITGDVTGLQQVFLKEE